MQVRTTSRRASTASSVVTLSQTRRCAIPASTSSSNGAGRGHWRPPRCQRGGQHRSPRTRALPRAKQIVDAATEAQTAGHREARRHAAERHAETVQTVAQTRAALKADYTTLVGQTASAVKATVAALERVAAAQSSHRGDRAGRGHHAAGARGRGERRGLPRLLHRRLRDFTKEARRLRGGPRLRGLRRPTETASLPEMPSVTTAPSPPRRRSTTSGFQRWRACASSSAPRWTQCERGSRRTPRSSRRSGPTCRRSHPSRRDMRVPRPAGSGTASSRPTPPPSARCGACWRPPPRRPEGLRHHPRKLEDANTRAALDADARQRLRGIEVSMSSLAEAIQALPVSTTADWNAHHKAIRGVTADAADAASAATVGFVEERCHAVAQSVATMQQTLAKLGADAAAQDRELGGAAPAVRRDDRRHPDHRPTPGMRRRAATRQQAPRARPRGPIPRRQGARDPHRSGRGGAPLHPAREGDAAGWYSDLQGEWTGSSPCTWRPARPAADGSVGRPYPIEGMPPPALVEAPAAMWVTDTKTGLVANIVARAGLRPVAVGLHRHLGALPPPRPRDQPCAAREVALCGTQIVHVPPEADVVVDRTVTLASIDDRDDQIQRAVVRDRAGATHSVTLFLDHRASDGGALLAGATPFTPCASRSRPGTCLRASARAGEPRPLGPAPRYHRLRGYDCGPVLWSASATGAPRRAPCARRPTPPPAPPRSRSPGRATHPAPVRALPRAGPEEPEPRQLAHVACSTVVGASPWSPAREDLQDLHEATRDLHADLDTVPRRVGALRVARPAGRGHCRRIRGAAAAGRLHRAGRRRARALLGRPERVTGTATTSAASEGPTPPASSSSAASPRRRPRSAPRCRSAASSPSTPHPTRSSGSLRSTRPTPTGPTRGCREGPRPSRCRPGASSSPAWTCGFGRVGGHRHREPRPAVVAGPAACRRRAVGISVAPESECIVTSCVTSAEGDVLDWDIEGYAAREARRWGSPLPVWRTLAAVRGRGVAHPAFARRLRCARAPSPPRPGAHHRARRPVRLAPPGSHAAAASRWAVEAKALARGYTGLRSALVSNLSDSQLRNVVLDRVFDEGTTKVAGMGRQELVNLTSRIACARPPRTSSKNSPATLERSETSY